MSRFGRASAHRSHWALLPPTILFFSLVGLLVAQTSLASTLSGHVTSGGQPVSGAFVGASGPSGGAGTVADAGGAYSLNLPDGTYRLGSDAPGFKAASTDGVTVSGASSHDLSLTASGTKLTSVPVFGGGVWVAADGTPGVFYISGTAPGELYRTTDYGGTWTQVTVAYDDPASGLSSASSPGPVVTSGFPGEVVVSIGQAPGLSLPTGVYFSTDYGVTWRTVGNPPANPAGTGGQTFYWGHAGSRSVLLLTQGGNTYVADMTAANPSFVQMTAPYAPAGQPIGVGNGADQPWLATVDASGQLSVFPLIAQATAPAAALSLSGFPANPLQVGIGGEGGAGVPPAGVVVASADHVTMTTKAPGAATYPAPAPAAPASCSAGLGLPAGLLPPPGRVTPNTAASYGAAGVGGCWVQDSGGTVTTGGVNGHDSAIDAGYDATDSSAGTDAVVMQVPPFGSRGVPKAAASNGGFPVGVGGQGVDAKPGTDPSSAGIAVDGITAPQVSQTTFGPAGAGQIASATEVGGVASNDGGASFHRAIFDNAASVAWWQGATASWLLFGLNNLDPNGNDVTGFLNWTSATPPVGNGSTGGNVSGSTAAALGGGFVSSIAGVPGQDTAFVDVATGNNFDPNRSGAVHRVSVVPGPSFSNVTPIGAGVINGPGRLVYCPGTGSASSLQDVLLAIGENGPGGGIYRVTGATGPSPIVAKVADLAGTGNYQGLPALRADCASGMVLAASGNAGEGLLESSDGGVTFGAISVPHHDAIRTIALTPGDPSSISVADAGGYVVSTGDGGHTWVVVNDPNTGVNLSSPAGGGLTDLRDTPGRRRLPGGERQFRPRQRPQRRGARRGSARAAPGSSREDSRCHQASRTRRSPR